MRGMNGTGMLSVRLYLFFCDSDRPLTYSIFQVKKHRNRGHRDTKGSVPKGYAKRASELFKLDEVVEIQRTKKLARNTKVKTETEIIHTDTLVRSSSDSSASALLQ